MQTVKNITSLKYFLDRFETVDPEYSFDVNYHPKAPETHFHTDITAALETLPDCPNSWMLVPESADAVTWKKISSSGDDIIKHHRVLIGSEGGFHQDEIKLSMQSGMRPVYLGPRILRSETAAMSAVSILQFLWGDL